MVITNRFCRFDKVSPSSNLGTFKFRRHYGQMSHSGLSNIAHLAIIHECDGVISSTVWSEVGQLASFSDRSRSNWKAQPLLFSYRPRE